MNRRNRPGGTAGADSAGASLRHVATRAPWPDPTCIVHIGIHKTGSTALQHYLYVNTARLRELGILVPRSGRLDPTPAGCGHHCIAWDLLGADPMGPVDASLEALIEEIRCSGMPIVCISSEEFSHLWLRPNNLARLVRGLRGIGYRAVIVAYLRPQVDYLEAMYAQVAQDAPVRDFWSCYREVVKHGAVDLWHQAHFSVPFDYARFLRSFVSIVGRGNVIVRPFRRFAAEPQLIADFMWIVARSRVFLEPSGTLSARSNARLRFADVILSVAKHRSLAADWFVASGDAIDRARAAEGPFEVLRAHEVARMCRRFAVSNLSLLFRYGIFVGCVSGVRCRKLLGGLAHSRRAYIRVRVLRSLFE